MFAFAVLTYVASASTSLPMSLSGIILAIASSPTRHGKPICHWHCQIFQRNPDGFTGWLPSLGITSSALDFRAPATEFSHRVDMGNLSV